MNSERFLLSKQLHDPSFKFRLTIAASILGAAALIAAVMIFTRPKPKAMQRGERAVLVNTTNLAPVTERVIIKTSGTVAPNAEINLLSKVSGTVTWIDPRFIPGGRFSRGEVILRIDPVDHEAALASAQALLARAESDMKSEEGLQDIARYEWEAMSEANNGEKLSALDEELALRKPHLKTAVKNMEAARAQVAQAEANLARTEVKAPFNCVVRSRKVNAGSYLTPQSSIADLAGLDSFWIRATVPVSDLKWIMSSGDTEEGSQVTVSSVPGIDLNAEWKGYVLRILPELEREGQQAQLLIEIPGPEKAAEGRGMLLLGAYVRLTIHGRESADIWKIPAAALHGGNSVWIMDAAGRLDIRTVETEWTGPEWVFLKSGVKDGETLVTSSIGAPVSGMLLQDASAPAPAGMPGKGRQ